MCLKAWKRYPWCAVENEPVLFCFLFFLSSCLRIKTWWTRMSRGHLMFPHHFTRVFSREMRSSADCPRCPTRLEREKGGQTISSHATHQVLSSGDFGDNEEATTQVSFLSATSPSSSSSRWWVANQQQQQLRGYVCLFSAWNWLFIKGVSSGKTLIYNLLRVNS